MTQCTLKKGDRVKFSSEATSIYWVATRERRVRHEYAGRHGVVTSVWKSHEHELQLVQVRFDGRDVHDDCTVCADDLTIDPHPAAVVRLAAELRSGLEAEKQLHPEKSRETEAIVDALEHLDKVDRCIQDLTPDPRTDEEFARDIGALKDE